MRPMHSIKGQGLRAFVKAIAPQYTPASSATLRKFMDAMYEERAKQLKACFDPLRDDKLNEATRGVTVCLITDAWGARNNKSYNATLATTLDDNFEQQLICLDMTEYEKPHHTAAVVQGMLESTLSEARFNIPIASLSYTVHDAGSNINRGTKGWDGVGSTCPSFQPTHPPVPLHHTTPPQLCPTPALRPPPAWRTRSSGRSSTPSTRATS
jgi:hypothetical protein